MSEGKAEIIPFPKEQPITPRIKRIAKKVQGQIRDEREDKEKSGIVDIDEERFHRNLRDLIES